MSSVLLLALIGFGPLCQIGVEASLQNGFQVTSFALSPKMSYQYYNDESEIKTLTAPNHAYSAPPEAALHPNYGYQRQRASTEASSPASEYEYEYMAPSEHAPVYGYHAAPHPQHSHPHQHAPPHPHPPPPPPEHAHHDTYVHEPNDYEYGHVAGDLPHNAADGGYGEIKDDSHAEDGPPPPPSPPPPPAPAKGSIDYILIPMILIGIFSPIFVVVYVVLGAIEAKMAPVIFKRSMSWTSAIAESWMPKTDALILSVSRALDEHECWERVACQAGTFCKKQGIFSSNSLQKKLETYVPQSYKRQYRAFSSAMNNLDENCSVYSCL